MPLSLLSRPEYVAKQLMALPRVMALIGLGLVSPLAFAGTIGFSVSFTGEEIAISNTGTEPGYQISMWSLDTAGKWQRLYILSGNADYLATGQVLKGRCQSRPVMTGLGRGDPLLLLLHDQAGSLISQLAWRQTPLPSSQSLLVQRDVSQLSVAAGDASIVATYAVVIPYEGISALATRLNSIDVPSDPVRHVWSGGAPLTLDTGSGQGGAWLVHETVGGSLQLQLVPDGLVRGKEQVPVWLNWVRDNLMTTAIAVGLVGLVMCVTGFFWRSRQQKAFQGNGRA